MVLPEVPVLAQQYARTNSLQDLVYNPLVGCKLNSAMNDLRGLISCDSVTHPLKHAREMSDARSEAQQVQIEIQG